MFKVKVDLIMEKKNHACNTNSRFDLVKNTGVGQIRDLNL